MKPMKIFILVLLAGVAAFCGPSERRESELVQPSEWWSVHPRPVYASLEKVGTFQSWFDVYKLGEGLFAIYEPNQFEEALSFLVIGSARAALIDTGTGIGNIRDVVEALTSLPVMVVLTHEHYDHVAGAWLFEDIVLYDNEDARKVLQAGRDNASLQKYVTGDYLWKPLPPDFRPETWTIPSIEPTRVVREGDIIDLGTRGLEVIYSPGHSPGSMCLLDRKHRILFTGDHFFPGPLYAHAPDVDVDAYEKSNERLCGRLEEFDWLCSGHNDPWVDGEVLLSVGEAFRVIRAGGGKFSEDDGLRRYTFDGFDILIRIQDIQ